jgi:hypothetical protein
VPTCTKCSVLKPAEDFGIRSDQPRLYTECRVCRNIRKMLWAKRHPEKRAEASHKYYASQVKKDPEVCRGRIGSAEWRARKKPDKTPYYYRNREHVLAKARARYRAKKTTLLAYNKTWRARNGARKSEQDRQWRAAHPELVALYSNNRRARKLQSQPKWLSAIQLAQMREFYDIAQARYRQTGLRHHVDHIFPLHGANFSGLHVPWNLQVLTKQSNLQKQQAVPSQYAHMLNYAR